MKRSDRIFHLYGHTIDFTNTFVRFDGVTLSKKERLIDMFKYLLKRIGYTFCPVSRPVPPILLNYQCIDRKFLNNWVYLCCRQICTIDEAILRLSYLSIEGFSLRAVNSPSQNGGRLVSLTLSADGYSENITTIIDSVPSIVKRFLSLKYNNKLIIIN